MRPLILAVKISCLNFQAASSSTKLTSQSVPFGLLMVASKESLEHAGQETHQAHAAGPNFISDRNLSKKRNKTKILLEKNSLKL